MYSLLATTFPGVGWEDCCPGGLGVGVSLAPSVDGALSVAGEGEVCCCCCWEWAWAGVPALPAFWRVTTSWRRTRLRSSRAETRWDSRAGGTAGGAMGLEEAKEGLGAAAVIGCCGLDGADGGF